MSQDFGRPCYVDLISFREKVVYGIDFRRVFRTKLVLGIADGFVEADGVRIYEAKDLRVGLFQPGAQPGA